MIDFTSGWRVLTGIAIAGVAMTILVKRATSARHRATSRSAGALQVALLCIVLGAWLSLTPGSRYLFIGQMLIAGTGLTAIAFALLGLGERHRDGRGRRDAWLALALTVLALGTVVSVRGCAPPPISS